MLTVITVDELKKLLVERKLTASENVEFLMPESLALLTETFKENKKADAANIIYLEAIEGTKVTQVELSEIEDPNTGYMGYLPQLEGPQVCLVIKNKEVEALLFSSEVLDEIESADLSTDESRGFAKELVGMGASDADGCVYALAGELKSDDIAEILYNPELEDVISKIKEQGEAHAILFKKTTLFELEE